MTMKNPLLQNAILLSFLLPNDYLTPRMRCPYCETPISSSAQECETCQLTFGKAAALFGAVPRIHREIFDSTRQLSFSQHKSISKHILHICSKFPQLYVQLVLHSFPPPHPMRTQVFWLFNAGGFSGETRRGPANHTLLIAIDPGRREACLMPGYGLEPFLDEEFLTGLLDATEAYWFRGDWPGGVAKLLELLEDKLETITQPVDPNLSISTEF
jgi:hypothetical protein